MYTAEQAQKLLQHYSGYLLDWKLELRFCIKSYEPISGAKPDQNTLYEIFCKKNHRIIDLVEACKESDLTHPFEVLKYYVFNDNSFQVNERRWKIFYTKSNDEYSFSYQKITNKSFSGVITGSNMATKEFEDIESEEVLLTIVRNFIEEFSDINFETHTFSDFL